jgi:hypothetical protein
LKNKVVEQQLEDMKALTVASFICAAIGGLSAIVCTGFFVYLAWTGQ